MMQETRLIVVIDHNLLLIMDIKLKSYNCRGLPRDRAKLLSRRPDIESLL